MRQQKFSNIIKHVKTCIDHVKSALILVKLVNNVLDIYFLCFLVSVQYPLKRDLDFSTIHIG